MTGTPAALADGFLPDAKGTLYTVPAATKLFVSLITGNNINATAQTIVLYVNRSGTSRIIAYVANFGLNYTLQFGSGLILEAGDLVEGQTTTANAVHYTLSGVLET